MIGSHQDLSRRLLATLAITGAVVLAGGSLSPAAAAPEFADNMCHANVQNAHVSASHGGVDLTATWYCDVAPVTINIGGGALNGSVAGLFIWLCPSSPQKTETYLQTHCVLKGTNIENISLPIAGAAHKVSRTTPPLAVPAAHGSGWWVGCTTWQSHGPGGAGAPATTFGNIVELSG
jgi:hypothetical protein